MSDPTREPPILSPDPTPPIHPASSNVDNGDDIPIIAIDVPVMFEDEGQEEMGETAPHTTSVGILFYGVTAHLSGHPRYQVYSDMNVYYHRIDRWAYISPDVMVVEPFEPLLPTQRSYRIGKDGPAPLVNIEVLSRRSFQQQDLHNKPDILSYLQVPEYILVDVTGEFLEQRLLLKRLLADGAWIDEQDADGGVTSRLGFRIVIDTDGQVRVLDAKTGHRYARPAEAEAEAEARRLAEEAHRQAEQAHRQEAEARRHAEERLRLLEAEIARLRGTPPADR